MWIFIGVKFLQIIFKGDLGLSNFINDLHFLTMCNVACVRKFERSASALK